MEHRAGIGKLSSEDDSSDSDISDSELGEVVDIDEYSDIESVEAQ